MTEADKPTAIDKIKGRNTNYWSLNSEKINSNRRLKRKQKKEIEEIDGQLPNDENDPTINDRNQIDNSVEEFMTTIHTTRLVFSHEYLKWLDKEAWNIRMRAGDIINYIMSSRAVKEHFFDLMSHDKRIRIVIQLEGISLNLPTDDKSLKYSTDNFYIISQLAELFKTTYYTNASSVVSRQTITAYILEQRKKIRGYKHE